MKYFLIFFVCLLMGCKTADNAQKSAPVPSDVSWLATPSFYIECTVAYPMPDSALTQLANLGVRAGGDTANRINLVGRGNFLKIDDGIVTADMAFYGEQRGGNFVPGRTGIIMDGPIENYITSVNERKNQTKISFTTKYKQERYDVIITKYASGKCSIDVNSYVRSFMQYDGLMKEFVEE